MAEGVADPAEKGYRQILQAQLHDNPDLAPFYHLESVWRDGGRRVGMAEAGLWFRKWEGAPVQDASPEIT